LRSSSMATETIAPRSLFWWFSWIERSLLIKWNGWQRVACRNAVSWQISWLDQQEYLTKTNVNISLYKTFFHGFFQKCIILVLFT
jgi:hypothetical protein